MALFLVLLIRFLVHIFTPLQKKRVRCCIRSIPFFLNVTDGLRTHVVLSPKCSTLKEHFALQSTLENNLFVISTSAENALSI
jgi:hypothetical protein